MAAKNVIGQQLGGDKKVFDEVRTVADVRSGLSVPSDYSPMVNGSAVNDNYELEDSDFVTFTRKTKGGI